MYIDYKSNLVLKDIVSGEAIIFVVFVLFCYLLHVFNFFCTHMYSFFLNTVKSRCVLRYFLQRVCFSKRYKPANAKQPSTALYDMVEMLLYMPYIFFII